MYVIVAHGTSTQWSTGTFEYDGTAGGLHATPLLRVVVPGI